MRSSDRYDRHERGATRASASVMTTKDKEQQAKDEASKSPGKEDLHEQREDNQTQEGTVAPKLPSADGEPRRSGAV